MGGEREAAAHPPSRPSIHLRWAAGSCALVTRVAGRILETGVEPSLHTHTYAHTHVQGLTRDLGPTVLASPLEMQTPGPGRLCSHDCWAPSGVERPRLKDRCRSAGGCGLQKPVEKGRSPGPVLLKVWSLDGCPCANILVGEQNLRQMET